MRSTHTYALLELSPAAHAEIARKLRAAGYDHAFDGDKIDMQGIGVTAGAEPGELSAASRDFIGADWRAAVQVEADGRPSKPAEAAAWLAVRVVRSDGDSTWVVARDAPAANPDGWEALCIVGNGANAGALACALSALPRLLGVGIELERLMRIARSPSSDPLDVLTRLLELDTAVSEAMQRVRDGGSRA